MSVQDVSAPAGVRLVYVEFHDGKPFALVTHERKGRPGGEAWTAQDYWDVEWCKRDGRFYRHCSGCGGGAICFSYTTDRKNRFWAADGVPVFFTGKDGYPSGRSADEARIDMPGGWTPEKVMGIDEAEGRIHYCPKCDDHMPDLGYSSRVCPHIGECHRCDGWNEPEEPCECRLKRKQAKERKRLGIKRVKTTLEAFAAEGERRFGPDKSKWRFQCPKCKRVACQKDYERLDFVGATGRSCVTARMPRAGAGCGLMEHWGLNPVVIVGQDGKATGTTYFALRRSTEGR